MAGPADDWAGADRAPTRAAGGREARCIPIRSTPHRGVEYDAKVLAALLDALAAVAAAGPARAQDRMWHENASQTATKRGSGAGPKVEVGWFVGFPAP